MKKLYRGSCHCGAIAFECQLDLAEGIREGVGQRDPARLQPDEDHPVEAVVALHDLVAHPPDGPADVVGVHHLRPGNENAPVRGR